MSKLNRTKTRRLARLAMGLATAIMALTVATAVAQTPPAATEDGAIVVPGQRGFREAVRAFVDDVSAANRGGRLARWDRRICAGVFGADRRGAQALIDRISMRAQAVGLDVGEPGCRANVLVIVAPYAQRFTPTFVAQNPVLFSRGGRSGPTRGGSALWEFTNVDRPVRWWHVSEVVTDRGQTLPQTEARTGGDSSIEGAAVARVSNTGRLSSGVREDFNRVIIIVDSRDTAEAPFSAVADYVAMVTLAQINPTGQIGSTPSILSLFSDREVGLPGPSGWTDWDLAYVRALYEAPRYSASSNLQEGAITSDMVKDLETKAPPQR